jgi:hypothetical protein
MLVMQLEAVAVAEHIHKILVELADKVVPVS